MSEQLFAVARNAAHSSWTYRVVRLAPVSRSLAASCVVPELRPLRSPGVTRLQRYYEPLRHLHRPGLSLAGAQLEGEPSTGETSLVASDVLRCMPMPLPRRNREVPSSFSSFTAAAFPQFGDGRLPHKFVSRLAQHSLTFRPATSPSRHKRPLHQRLGRLRHLHHPSSCYRLERPLPDRTCTCKTSNTFSRRTQIVKEPIVGVPPSGGLN